MEGVGKEPTISRLIAGFAIFLLGTGSVFAFSPVSLDIPQPARVEQLATKEVAVKLANGAAVSIPAGATISVGDGPFAAYVESDTKITLEVNPIIQILVGPELQSVGMVYDVVLKNEAGGNIRELYQPMELILPYSDEEAAQKGIREDDLHPRFFDEAAKIWQEISDFSVDKNKNLVVAKVFHLTRFAIVAKADIIPPSPPTAVELQALGNGRVEITWKNPSRDFSHTKIYRSLKQGELGTVLAREVGGERFVDSTMSDGVLYYYVVRAVDPAGNESLNQRQVNVLALGSGLSQVPGAIEKKESKSITTPQDKSLSDRTKALQKIPSLPPELPKLNENLFSRILRVFLTFFKNLFSYGK